MCAVAGAAASMKTTILAMSSWCVKPLASNSCLLHLSLGGFRGEGLVLRYGRSKHLWSGVVQKKSNVTLRWPQPSCALLENGGSDGGGTGTRQRVRMPLLERDENGKLFLKRFSGAEDFESREEVVSNSKQSRTAQIGEPQGTKVVRETKSINGTSGKTPSSTTVKVNLGTLNPRARRLASAKVPSKGAPLYSKAARRFYNEKFRAEPQRLSKVLAAAGVASRRACEEVIFAGRVSVNGSVCKIPQTPVDPLKDNIYVDGHSLPKKMAPKLYFALNKPKGYLCSAGEEGTKPVLSLFDEYMKVWAQKNPGLAKPRIFTVGRLDVATSGLLLVTNDGEFAQKVSHPSSGLTKEYVATVDKKVSKRQLQVIASGTTVQGVLCVPIEVGLVEMEAGDERQRIKIVVSEGRNHEVRHLIENCGLQVLALKRTRIGSLRLSRKLGLGKFDELTETQAAKMMAKELKDIS